MPGTPQPRWAVRALAAIAVVLYAAAFVLPDRWVYWAAGPDRPGVADETYLFPAMMCSAPQPWQRAVADTEAWAFVCALAGSDDAGWWWDEPLDYAGWYAHLATAAGLALLTTGRGRGAAIVACVAVACGVVRQGVADANVRFAEGYYAWLTAVVLLAVAGVIRSRAEFRSRHPAE